MQAAAAYSHRADKVSDCVPLAPTTAYASLMAPLSLAAVFALATVHARTCHRLNALTATRQSVSITACTNAASVTSAVASMHETGTLPLVQRQPPLLPPLLRLRRCLAVRVVASTS